MNQFNHKFKNLSDALGISKQRRTELQEICEHSYKKGKCMSETLENILSHGLSVIETLYCGYITGMVDAKMKNRFGEPDIKMIKATSPEDLMNKLKDLLRGQIEDQDES